MGKLTVTAMPGGKVGGLVFVPAAEGTVPVKHRPDEKTGGMVSASLLHLPALLHSRACPNIANFRNFSANFTENRPFPRVRAKVHPKSDDWDRLYIESL
jgi:hypothetical protein